MRSDSFVDMDDDADDDDIHNLSMHDASGRHWTETRDGRFVSGDHDAFSDYHGFNNDPTEDYVSNKINSIKQDRMKRAMRKDEMKHEEKMKKLDTKSKVKELMHNPKVKMLAKLAMAVEALKLMIDHHEDKIQNDKDKTKEALAKLESNEGKSKIQNVTRKLQNAGFLVEPKDVKAVMQSQAVGGQDGVQHLFTTIKDWVQKLETLLSGDWGVNLTNKGWHLQAGQTAGKEMPW